MKILEDLGINSTLFVQLILFLVAFFALSKLLFRPYLLVFHEREKKTVGDENQALRLIQDTDKIKEEYEQKARSLNLEFKTIFDQKRNDALKEHDEIVNQSRKEASQKILETQSLINEQIDVAKNKLEAEVPLISDAIIDKLIDKSHS